MSTRFLGLLAVGCWLALPAAAQQVRVHVLADSVTVGERFEVAVAVEHGRSTRVVFPDLPAFGNAPVEPAAAFGDAEVFAARRLPPTETPGGARVDSVVFAAATFALDAARVGPIPLGLVAGRDTVALDGPVRTLPVRSVVPDSLTAPLPLEPPVGFPRPLSLWAALLVGALLAAAAAWLWRTRRRRAAPPAPPLPPREEALARLDALDPEAPAPSAPDASAVQTYYAALADALRTYLTRALGVPALEQTTRELLDALDRHPDVDDATRRRVGAVLHRADLAKFARAAPDADARAADRATVRESVETMHRRAADRENEESGEEETAIRGDGETATARSDTPPSPAPPSPPPSPPAGNDRP